MAPPLRYLLRMMDQTIDTAVNMILIPLLDLQADIQLTVRGVADTALAKIKSCVVLIGIKLLCVPV